MKRFQNMILFAVVVIIAMVSYYGTNGEVVEASIIGTLVTGAGVLTSFDKDKLHQFIQIGTIDTDLPITTFLVTISGQTYINIVGQSFVQGFAKLVTAGLLGADVKKGMLLPVSSGGAGNVACNYSMKNAGATTPSIFGKSIQGYDPSLGHVTANMVAIQDGDSRGFEGYDYLLVDPTNLQDDVSSFIFQSGWSEAALNLSELPAITSLSEAVLDADGKLAGLVLIDAEIVAACQLFASGGKVDVLVINLP